MHGNCCCPPTPIIIDTEGNDYSLTDVDNGVLFDINGDGLRERVSWTVANGSSAFLVLDRDGNGSIDDGTELFGNYTTQPVPPPMTRKNGFLALATFDATSEGGNGDGKITSTDGIFEQLRLWHDFNHNGQADSGELMTLSEADILGIELDYKESRRTDQYGNYFRYRAKVLRRSASHVARWAWDVLLKSRALPESQ